MAGKKDDLVQVKMQPTRAQRLRLVAEMKEVTPAELLRRAATAILEHFDETGDVPLDMQIVQRRVIAPRWQAAEDNENYGEGKPSTPKPPPPKPPDKSGRIRGAGPDHRVPKAS